MSNKGRRRVAWFAVGFAVTATFAGWPVFAQQMTDMQKSAIRESCRSDYMKHCSSVPPGTAQSLACLQQHAGEVSGPCKQALGAASKDAVPTASTQAPTAASQANSATPATGGKTSPAASPPALQVASAEARAWPVSIANERGSAVIYQPQVISWPDMRTLNARIALALTPLATKKETLGTIEVAFKTNPDLGTRTVTLSSPKLQSVRFPGADAEQTRRFEEAIANALETMGERRVPLDTVLMSLNRSADVPPAPQYDRVRP